MPWECMLYSSKNKQCCFFPLHKTAVFITKAETSLFIQGLEKRRAILISLTIKCITKRQLTPAVTKLILFVPFFWDPACRWLGMIAAHFCKCWRRGQRHTAQRGLLGLRFWLAGCLWEQEECRGYVQIKGKKLRKWNKKIMSKTKKKWL